MATNKKITILILIFITLGAFLRFYRLEELGTFHSDQAIELSQTLEIIKGKPRLIGIKTSISEVHNGAVMYYLLAPLLWLLNYNPVAGGILQSLFSLATIPIVYFLGKRKGYATGLTAAFLTAASPLLVTQSRQTLLAFYPFFFSGLIFLILTQIIKKFDQKKTILLGFLLGFTLQIHYLAFILFVFCLLASLYFVKKPGLILFYLSNLFFGLLIGLLPLIVFELRHEFFNTKMLSLYLKEGGEISLSYTYILNFWPQVVAQLFFADNTLLGLAGFLLIGITLIIKFRKRIKLSLVEKLSLLLFVLNFISLFIFSLRHGSFRTQKAIIAFIPLIILLSINLNFLAGKLPGQWRRRALFIFLLGLFLLNLPAFGLKNNHGQFMREGWNLPGTKKTAEIIIKDLDNKLFNVVMLVDAENQGFPLRYFLEVAGKSPLGIEKYQEAEVLYVLKEPELELEQVDLWELSVFKPFKIIKEWHIQDGFYLYRLEKKSDKFTVSF